MSEHELDAAAPVSRSEFADVPVHLESMLADGRNIECNMFVSGRVKCIPSVTSRSGPRYPAGIIDDASSRTLFMQMYSRYYQVKYDTGSWS